MRNVITVVGLVAAVGIALGPACGSNKTSTDQPTGKVTVAAATGGPTGLGVGAPCEADAECRPGLACENGACAPAHSTPAGGPCVISAECQDGLFCAAGVCAEAGEGADGASCTSDADCASGFKCALAGFGAECVAEGTGDVGAACTTAADCYGGLACLEGACGVAAPGTPPFGPPWPGIECPDESGPVEAYFRVPRGADDGDFYRLPFPNDVRLVSGKPDLSGHPTPGAGLLGYDVVDRYLRAVEERNDGWGLYHSTLFRFSGELDPDSFSGNVHLANLTQAQGLSLYYAYSISRGSYLCPNWVAVRQGLGRVYEPGQTYAVYMTTGLKAKGGAPIARSPDLAALLATTAPSDSALAAVWPRYQPLRDYLAAGAIDPATVLNATVFTVGRPRDAIEKLQTAIEAAPPPTATGWTRCDAGVASPCPDATGDRACPAADPAFDELHALVSLPIYQEGTAPYLTPEDGGDIALDAAGDPVVVRTEEVCMSLTVPKGAVPPGGWPTVVFAHGTDGHFRTHVVAGVAKDFAQGVDDGQGNVVAAAVLGIDQVSHGPRRNGAAASPNELFYNFANPAAARGNARQSAVDQMALLRFAPSVSLDAMSSPTGAAFALSTGVALWGHSQGATAGSLALPYGAWTGAVLAGNGAGLVHSFLSKTSPTNVAAAVPFVLGDVGSDGKLRGGIHHPVLGLMQTLVDGADPIAYAALATKSPPAGETAHHLLLPYGLADSFSPGSAMQAYAVGAGLGLAAHDPSVGAADDIGGLTTIPVPVSGNLTVAGAPVTGIVRQYAPAAGEDGHFVAFDLPSARGDAERFLAGALAGGLPQVGD